MTEMDCNRRHFQVMLNLFVFLALKLAQQLSEPDMNKRKVNSTVFSGNILFQGLLSLRHIKRAERWSHQTT